MVGGGARSSGGRGASEEVREDGGVRAREREVDGQARGAGLRRELDLAIGVAVAELLVAERVVDDALFDAEDGHDQGVALDAGAHAGQDRPDLADGSAGGAVGTELVQQQQLQLLQGVLAELLPEAFDQRHLLHVLLSSQWGIGATLTLVTPIK